MVPGLDLFQVVGEVEAAAHSEHLGGAHATATDDAMTAATASADAASLSLANWSPPSAPSPVSSSALPHARISGRTVSPYAWVMCR